MILSLIAAMSENRVIGEGNRLPWNLPEDLKRFRALTRGHTILMGRKTFESIGRLLPDRRNIILTRNKDYRVAGAEIFHSLQEALDVLQKSTKPEEEVFVIGGAQIYLQAMASADRIYLTRVHRNIAGDAFFPEITPQFSLSESEAHPEFTYENYTAI